MFYRLKFNLIYLLFFMSICAFIILIVYHSLNIGFCSPAENLQTENVIVLNDYVKSLLELTRQTIKIETWKYNFSYSGVEKLKDLVPESGGAPVISIVASTWRSGSSFLGDIINAVPGSFYTYEPFKMFDTYYQIRGPPYGKRAVTFLKNSFKCNYVNETDINKYMKYTRTNVNQFKRNKRFWDKCQYKQELCFDESFMKKMCMLFPFQTVKLDRLRLHLVKYLLEDKKLNLKVVLLVRDPRGVMHSRRIINNFCSSKNIPDCADPRLLCSDMVADYKEAKKLLIKYPDKLMVLRYEDLALNIDESIDNLFTFLRLELTSSVQDFLQTHTSQADANYYSTFRDTKKIPFKWKKELLYKDVEEIQNKCREAMTLWGYNIARNVSHLTSSNFNPLLPYSI